MIQQMRGGPQAEIDDERLDEALPGWVNETIAYQRPSGGTSGSVPASAGSSSSSLSTGSGYFDTVAKMIAEVADALEHAHDQGVIHRDINPSNLLLAPDGRLSVNDFGLARMLEQPGMTMTGEFVPAWKTTSSTFTSTDLAERYSRTGKIGTNGCADRENLLAAVVH